MSVKTATFYAIECDWPGCGAISEDGEYHRFWEGEDVAADCARDGGWWEGVDVDEWFCNAHPMAWESDHEDGTAYPPRPFLFIHDGGHAYDGKVSLRATDEATA